ncbi:MAG: glycosyltransferase family 4 protein [Planctomycetota bacterium]
MKISISCKYFAPRGGAQTFLFNFAEALLDSGHRVKVHALEVEADTERMEVEQLRIPAVPKALRDVSYARASRRAMDRSDADVTFGEQKSWGAQVVRPGGGVHLEYLRQVVKSYPLAPQRLLKSVTKPYSPKELLNLFIERKLYAAPDLRCVVANSKLVRRHLLKHYPELRGRVALVYNGVDCEQYSPRLREQYRESVRDELNIPREAMAAVFVAFDWRRKGLATLIRALGRVKPRRTARPVYAIGGGKGDRRLTRTLARWGGAEDRLRFVGPADPAPYYGAADVLTLPTYFDPCANVILEGIGCGLPAITTVHNGAHELLTDGQDGYVMQDPADADELADYLAECADRDDLDEAKEAARGLAREHTVEKMYGELEDILVATAEGAGVPRHLR